MSSEPRKKKRKAGRKVRVEMRRNRAGRPRETRWTRYARDDADEILDARTAESLSGKGDLTRRRTVIEPDETSEDSDSLTVGTVVAMRGLYADVDDGRRVLPCTVRRVLRTRLIRERHPVTVGDRVRFRLPPESQGVVVEGVIESVAPRGGELRRLVNRRVQTIVANVDQAVIVSAAAAPPPKPHLIDRYLVAAHAGNISPLICVNKMDLDQDRSAGQIADRYRDLGYRTICTSALTGQGIEELTAVLKDKASALAGQSGVGKSSLLNAVQPGLRLAVADVVEHTRKGRHTTTTAMLHRLDVGGYVVDTPGVRSFDLSIVPRSDFEAYFVEFRDRVKDCKFPDCTHTHEVGCAIKRAVEHGEIARERFDSYVRMFEEPPDADARCGE